MTEEQDRDALFLQIARERGLLDDAGERLCRETQTKLAGAGYSRSLAQIAFEKGLLTTEQVREIRREMARRGVLPRLGGYELIAKLGQGGMGTVYKARQVSLDRLVALKVLARELAADKTYVERFRREGLIAARITHPNAVQIYDVGEDRGQPFIAMEYVDGVSADRLLKSGALDEHRALAIVRGVAAALQVAHERGIVHRDIKPANILLTKDGQPKLADLGIARQSGVESTTLTKTGATVGTAHYMSPEQCRGARDIDCRSDIYSLGATLFHLVCGKPPYEGETGTAIMLKHITDPLPDPRGVNPRISDATADLIRRMMAKDAAERIPTCGALIGDMDAPAAAQSRRVPADDVAESPARPDWPQAQPLHENADLDSKPADEEAAEDVATPSSMIRVEAPPAPSAPRRPLPIGLIVGVVLGIAALAMVVITIVVVNARRGAAMAVEEQRRATETAQRKADEAQRNAEQEHEPAPAVTVASPATTKPAVSPATPPPQVSPPAATETVATPTTWPFNAAEANRRQSEAAKLVRLPAGWTSAARRVTVATPQGDQAADITFDKNTIGMEFVQIPAGEFVMGSPAGEKDRSGDEVQHKKVRLTKSFLLGATEVTQSQWQAVMGSNPSQFKGANNPVDSVSWDDCQDFLKKLCAKEGVPVGTYRLPTEAEWEYACRAGTTTRFYSGDADSVLDAVAWYTSNSGKTTHPVGGKKPNAWGLYDTSGNVWEWCQDWYGNYYDAAATDPQGPATGQSRVLRDGSWNSNPRLCRSAYRHRRQPADRLSGHGFRVVLVLSPRP